MRRVSWEWRQALPARVLRPATRTPNNAATFGNLHRALQPSIPCRTADKLLRRPVSCHLSKMPHRNVRKTDNSLTSGYVWLDCVLTGFPGSNSTSHYPAPGAQPAGLDVDLSGLSEEEKRQIAQVMERAQSLQDTGPTPTLKWVLIVSVWVLTPSFVFLNPDTGLFTWRLTADTESGRHIYACVSDSLTSAGIGLPVWVNDLQISVVLELVVRFLVCLTPFATAQVEYFLYFKSWHRNFQFEPFPDRLTQLDIDSVLWQLVENRRNHFCPTESL